MSAQFDGTFVDIGRRSQQVTVTQDKDYSIESISEEEISDTHRLGPQGKIIYIPGQL
jgi:hypothetical protein